MDKAILIDYINFLVLLFYGMLLPALLGNPEEKPDKISRLIINEFYE